LNNKDKHIFLSSGAFRTTSLSEIVAICADLNLYNIELSSGLQYSHILESEIVATHQKCNILIHNYFPPPEKSFVLNLASEKPDVLKLSREHCQRAIQLSAMVEAPFYSVHSGFAFHVNEYQLGKKLSDAPRYSLEKAKTIFIESLKLLCEYADAYNIKIAIENNVVAPMNLIEGKNLLLLGATADDLLELTEKVSKKNLGLLIDVGHLKVTAGALQFDPIKFIHDVEPYIIAFHLSDNDGISDSNKLFEENAWFLDEIRRFPDHCKVIESFKLTVEQMKKEIALVRLL